jgi:hypothetical protein
MNIKTFEAYKGPSLDKIDRRNFLNELIDIFTDQQICGSDVNGTTYQPNDEILYLETNTKTIKLDLSDLGIEIGTTEWTEDDDFIFTPEINLDSDITKQVKNYKQNIHKYNV